MAVMPRLSERTAQSQTHGGISTACSNPHHPASATRRKLSVHIVGRAHAGELAAPAPSGVEMVEQPQELGKQLPLWPAMLGDAHACSN